MAFEKDAVLNPSLYAAVHGSSIVTGEVLWSIADYRAYTLCIIPQEMQLIGLNNPLWLPTTTTAVFPPVQPGCEMFPCTGCSCVLAITNS